MICVFGSINMDLRCDAPAIPAPGETVLGAGLVQGFGGKGANQAVAAARAGARVEMVGAVGADAFGAACRDNLARHGVGTGGVATMPAATGCALIVVDAKGENAITVAAGANHDLAPAPLPEGTTLLLCQMEVPVDAVLEMLRRARAAGRRGVLNLAPVPAGLDAATARALLDATDILVVNAQERAALAALVGTVEGPGLAVIETLGPKGAALTRADGSTLHLPAAPLSPRDTTGAGDSFAGCLAAGLDLGLPLETAAARAISAAGRTCLHEGAQPAPEARAG
ncbi:PfkB family carbohydrate kinase [Limimaricola pyoseonensis]|uniref:Ribokinase n=1 Tax=Limimaricola pyoseonensis TaxID=521013 RepID=A0A1G7HJB0_9RHOB|nr:PfkB family carbohydrate kinase [Limimaricola pyoseonensis]SDF00079.1 ribokinase [Limimaricola pyoseonensis]